MRYRPVGEAGPRTAPAIGRRSGPGSQLLEAGEADQCRLHLHIL